MGQIQGDAGEAVEAGSTPRTDGRRPALNGLEAVGQGVQLGKREQGKSAQGDGQRREQAAVALVGAGGETERHARLLGAADALRQATGMTLAWERLPGGEDVAGPRAT